MTVFLQVTVTRLAWAFAAVDDRSPKTLSVLERLHPTLVGACAEPTAMQFRAEKAALAAKRERAKGGATAAAAAAAAAAKTAAEKAASAARVAGGVSGLAKTVGMWLSQRQGSVR